MTKLSVQFSTGAEKGTVDVDDAVFGIEPNVPVMHQVVVAQLAARRAGTQSTKTRSEVSGGGAKPWKQKGTGRARAGTTRAPHWRGGGVAMGPKPRKYTQRTPKKMIKLALRSALSDRAASGNLLVVDSFGFTAPSTKAALTLLDALKVTGRFVVVVADTDATAWKSFRNIPGAKILEVGELNAYDVLVADNLIVEEAQLAAIAAKASGAAKATEEVAA